MSAQPLQCPISLDSPPICPQITPCGHVFAFPSIMQVGGVWGRWVLRLLRVPVRVGVQGLVFCSRSSTPSVSSTFGRLSPCLLPACST
jgi:hypothetical protein